MREPAGDEAAWETLSGEDALARLGSRPRGLTLDEAAARLERVGPNALPRARPPTRIVVFLRQFRNPLIYLLAGAALVALALGKVIDASFIAFVLLLNALIGGIQEWRAEQGAQALQRLLRVRAVVERDGEVRTVDAESLVPGDVVWIEAGARVPADVRLITSFALEVDESLLTGESTPVEKDADWLAERRVPAADRANVAHAATTVARGRASGVVFATGRRTVVGSVARDVIEAKSPLVPLLARMRRFTRLVGVAVVGASVLLALLGIALGRSVEEMLFIAVATAVAVVPEGLPVALTVCLAVAASRMAKRNVVVRRLAAVEGLGSCTLIATDKTGTLTMNALTVRVVRTPAGIEYDVGGEGFEPLGSVTCEGRSVALADDADLAGLAKAVALCNEATLRPADGGWAWTGDPTDVAMLAFALKLGVAREDALARAPQVGQVPFDPAARYAATIHDEDGSRVYLKGAPEQVIGLCEGDEADARSRMEAAVDLAQRGHRVLAVAVGEAAEDGAWRRLRFAGLVGMVDPPRPGVHEAVVAAQEAGVSVVMVTGDHPVTALAIARELGIATSSRDVVTGAEMDAWDESAWPERVRAVRVFARVAPHQKLLIVEAARRAGHFVAVTGDGVNDAPALRVADIGVAMGRAGTDVARDAADLVLADDDFSSVVAGVEEGRAAYANVRNVTFLLVSTGAAELLLMILAVVTGSPLPLLPAQLLWLNLVTNGIQDVALSMEPKVGDELASRPRPPRQRLFDRLMLERTILGGFHMGVVGFLAFQAMLSMGAPVESARNGLLLLMVLFENVHVGNSRSETRSAFALSPLRNPVLLVGTIGAQALHILVLYIPATQAVLRVEPVDLTTWASLLLVALTILVPFEIHKAVRRRRALRAKEASA